MTEQTAAEIHICGTTCQHSSDCGLHNLPAASDQPGLPTMCTCHAHMSQCPRCKGRIIAILGGVPCCEWCGRLQGHVCRHCGASTDTRFEHDCPATA